MKVINDVIGYKNLKIVQEPKWFSFSLDSVILPRFVTINKDVKNILDLGTGNAPIPIILTARTRANICGIEIQKDVYELATESIKLNNLEDQVKVINDDMKNLHKYFNPGFFDVIVSNPPYFKMNENSNINEDEHKTIARHEAKINLEEVIAIGSLYLKDRGTIAIVNRADRLVEIIEFYKKYGIEPKRMQFVYPKNEENANIVLIEGRKGGKNGLKILSPIIAHQENGEYSEKVKEYFS